MPTKTQQKQSRRRRQIALLLSQALERGIPPAEIARRLVVRPSYKMTASDRARRLIAQALEAGLPRAAIARELGVSERSVYRWGTGETTPLPSLLSALSDLVDRQLLR